MGLAVNALNKFAKSNIGTKLYRWAASEGGQKWLSTTLPTLETAAATSLYIIATERQKNLNRREKNVLQWQNVITGILGIGIGTYINKKVFAFGDKVIEHLDPQRVPDVHKAKGAIRVLFPVVGTALIMRWLLPVATAFVSGEIEERKTKKKLDVTA